MKANVKTVKITIPNEAILKKITTTPALKILTRGPLQVGENIERVNHYQFAQLLRMYPTAGAQVNEIETGK